MILASKQICRSAAYMNIGALSKLPNAQPFALNRRSA
jgi:hypothetical protein